MSAIAIYITVPGKPVGKERPRMGKHGVYTPTKTKKFERLVYVSALERRPWGWSREGRFDIEVSCYFPDLHRRDVDNVLKSVMDGMKGVIYDDDAQVSVAKVKGMLDRERPRTEIIVRRLVAAVPQG